MGKEGAGAAEPNQLDGAEGPLRAGRARGQPGRGCDRGCDPPCAVRHRQRAFDQLAGRHSVLPALRDLVSQRLDLRVPAAAHPGPRRLGHRGGAFSQPKAEVLLQRIHAPARDLDRRDHRHLHRQRVQGAGSEPRDVALLHAREPNLIGHMHGVRSPRVQRAGALPAVGKLVNQPPYAALVADFGRERVVEAIRAQVEAERRTEPVGDEQRLSQVETRLRAEAAPRLRRVINASGVILHTNLGRAPLSRAALDALAVAASYSNLELDLATGKRGERAALLAAPLINLFGAESALVVNNAAAVLLALTALCKGREVIVSRGQQVEIGGSFRMPDVMRLSGARMVEVGTTNRTRAADYEDALTARTAALLRVHTSNYTVSGFTETVSLREMEEIARRHNLLLIDDLGSGAVEPIAGEPTVADSVAHCDVVTFSGDKLFGGPQAGIVLGRADAVSKMAHHPLARAVRIDKLTLAALEATIKQRLAGRGDDIPVQRMLGTPVADVRRRAAMWSVKLQERGVDVRLVDGESAVGGGSVPGHGLPTVLLALAGSASRMATALRDGEPPVIAGIEDGACCIDPRTVLKGEDEVLIDAVEAAAKSVR